jgi:hypothetical protein
VIAPLLVPPPPLPPQLMSSVKSAAQATVTASAGTALRKFIPSLRHLKTEKLTKGPKTLKAVMRPELKPKRFNYLGCRKLRPSSEKFLDREKILSY